MKGWSASTVHGAMQVQKVEKERAIGPCERNDRSKELGPARFGPALTQLGMRAGSIWVWLLFGKWIEVKKGPMGLDKKARKNFDTKNKNKIEIKTKIKTK